MTAYAPPEALALTPGHGVARILRKPVAIGAARHVTTLCGITT